MKKTTFYLLTVILLSFSACSKENVTANYEIIPLPQKIEAKSGDAFVMNSSTTISYPQGNEALKKTAEFLSEYMALSTGLELSVSDKVSDNSIILKTDYSNENHEAYSLIVDAQQIVINGASDAATFYGVQTLRKAVPSDSKGKNVLFPEVEIEDAPRFAYRGMMLDVGRHFYSVDFVKKYIDMIALHNMNVFHWHLTDDQGWRIEIKKYPKLIEIGSQRKGTVIGNNTGENDGKPYGGFYTQEEIKDVVAYASERFITVVPEIDLPGHMVAALASYPELGCTGGPYEVEMGWGVFDDVLCAGKENTFEFLEGVFEELVELFPSEYIHVGGDECPKVKWKACPNCQARIKQLGIRGDKEHSAEEKLQSYVISRIEKYLNSKGRQIIGWDEILEGGLAPNASVMSWRGMDGGILAAKQKNNVVMTPNSHLYFNTGQTLGGDDFGAGGYLPLDKVYAFEPVPSQLVGDERKYVIGTQANVWTERLTEDSQIEYQVLPRMSALAEVQWSAAENKDYKSFLLRLGSLTKLFDKLNYNYAKEFMLVSGDIKSNMDKGVVEVSLLTFDNADVYYTLDGTSPTTQSLKYTQTIDIKETCVLKAIAIRNGQASAEYSNPFYISKATLKPVTLKDMPHERYTFGGASILSDGMKGGSAFNDASWLGFFGKDMDAVIDLKEATEISNVRVGTHINVDHSIVGASALIVFVSDNGKTFKQIAEKSIDPVEKNAEIGMVNIDIAFNAVKARYVKVIVARTILPKWHGAVGTPPFLFVDEIEIN